MSAQKIIRIGQGSSGHIFCKIKFENNRLSITGVEGPRADGNAYGACGQIFDSIQKDLDEGTIKFAPGWDKHTVQVFLNYWRRWHLNDMQAGTPDQMEVLRNHRVEWDPNKESYYDWAKRVLTDAGLQPDPNYFHNGKPYSYGSAWLFEEVPPVVINILFMFTDTDKQPAWV